jgi:hypothetical protein
LQVQRCLFYKFLQSGSHEPQKKISCKGISIGIYEMSNTKAMKTSLISIFLFSVIIINGIAQDEHVLVASAENIPDRLTLIKSAIALPEAHENIFWNLYEQYEEQRIKDNDWSVLQSTGGSGGDNAASLNTASSYAMDFLNLESDRVKLKRKYFDKIESALNGSVALQFLQSEALLDLLQRSRVYEKMDEGRPEWKDVMLKDEHIRCQVMEFTLGLSREDAERFRPIFENYQFDYSRIVGHQYLFFEQYVDDVTGLTPNQCKNLGKEFLNMQQEEVIVRKNYFDKMQNFFGVKIAMRFLAVDYYYSLMEKLKTWSDATLYASK